ncbi:hypothetical protein G9444_3623 [Rhodococcus erythropolis]|uniref:Uncharacterized protein n=1 Tax=Rhodococcus erythropolis TaxID=1833 RepID=A0A6G9CV42_RHOER|nr:hypothetical protein G9444_3623 [Rhodococcus erythropolis]
MKALTRQRDAAPLGHHQQVLGRSQERPQHTDEHAHARNGCGDHDRGAQTNLPKRDHTE